MGDAIDPNVYYRVSSPGVEAAYLGIGQVTPATELVYSSTLSRVEQLKAEAEAKAEEQAHIATLSPIEQLLQAEAVRAAAPRAVEAPNFLDRNFGKILAGLAGVTVLGIGVAAVKGRRVSARAVPA